MVKPEIQVSRLKYYALENARTLIPEEEAEKTDVTREFFKEIQNTIQNKELLNIQILGEVATGKSTIAMTLGWHTNTLLKQKMGLDKICADQLEFKRKMMQGTWENVCMIIDEWSELGRIGLDSSIETAFLKWHSDLAAQKFVHKISCSPTTVLDPNANIILTVVGTNRQTKMSRCTVKYRIITPEAEQMPTIGHIDIDVSQTLKQNWYKKYLYRKFKKMDLVMKEGIKDIREMETAELILNTYEKLKNLAKRGLVSRDQTSSFVDLERGKLKQMHSILTTEDIVGKTLSLLKLKKEETKLLYIIEKEANKKGKPNKKMIADLNQGLKEIRQGLKEQIDTYKRLIQINKEYEAI